MIQVLEHMQYPHYILKKCRSLLREKGILYIDLPNCELNYLKMHVKKLIGIEPFIFGHINFFSRTNVKKILKYSGFEELEIRKRSLFNTPGLEGFIEHYSLNKGYINFAHKLINRTHIDKILPFGDIIILAR